MDADQSARYGFSQAISQLSRSVAVTDQALVVGVASRFSLMDVFSSCVLVMIGSAPDSAVVLFKLVAELPLELTELDDCDEAAVPAVDLLPAVLPFRFRMCNGIRSVFRVG